MADKIKGITIEFKGNATQLQKSIRDTNKEIAKTQKELNAVNKALKFNPTSVELWRQKQELLTQKVKQTEIQLDQLKQAQKQMDASGVDKNSAEYRKLQREIVETESKLKTFKAQLNEVGNYKLKALSEGFKQAGEKMTQVGTGLTKNVTAPIVAVGAASVKAFNEVKDGLNIVAQKTGATGKELESMQTSARNLAKSIPTDFETAGTAIGEVNTRFGATGKTLEELSEQYVKFAKVNGVDLNDSIDETQKALAAFGKSAKDAPALLDTLTRAGQMTGASVDDLTSGLIQNATAFQELGLNIDQSVMLMAQMEKSGANSETVMQGMRKALKNAAKEGKPLNEALSDLQNTILNGTGSMDGLTAAYDLFGKSGDQIYGAVKNGTLDFTTLGAAVDDTKGALNAVFEETLTPAERFQTTMNSVKDAGYEIGSTIMTALEPALQKIAEKMQAISEWWGKLSPETQEAITKALMIAAAIGPIILIVGKLATALGAIIGIVNTVGAVIGGLAAALGATIGIVNTVGAVIGGLAAGPMIAIVAAIAAVIAIGVLLYKNWDKIKQVAQQVGNSIKNTWNSVKTAVTNAVNALKTNVTNAWNSVKNTVEGAASQIYESLTYPFNKAWDIIQSIIKKIKSFFPLDIGAIFENIELPHLSIEWTELTALGKTIKFPSGFDIDWYKNGGIFSSPSIIGVGEAGSEAVVPLDKFWNKLDAMQGGGDQITINVYAYEGMNVKELAAEIEKRLVQVQKQRSAAYGGIQ